MTWLLNSFFVFFFHKKTLDKSANHENNRQTKLKVLNVLGARRKCTQTLHVLNKCSIYRSLAFQPHSAGGNKTKAKRKQSIDGKTAGKNGFYYMIYVKSAQTFAGVPIKHLRRQTYTGEKLEFPVRFRMIYFCKILASILISRKIRLDTKQHL